MPKKLYTKDSGGTVRDISELHVKDSGGTVRLISEGYIKDAGGALRQFWPPITAPFNVSPPTISGSTTIGSTLTCTPGTWGGDPTPTLTYQWQNNGVDIPGETNLTYTTVVGDSGDDITCVETATNTGGTDSATSNTLVPGSDLTPSWLGYVSATWNGSQSSANIEFLNDGTVTTDAISGSTTNGTWYNAAPVGGVGALYEIMYDETGGNWPAQGDAKGVWLPLNIDRSWFITNPNNGTIRRSIATVSIREIATPANIITKSQTIECDNS